jgi:hypothetical protein
MDDEMGAFQRQILGLESSADRKLLVDRDVRHRPELLRETEEKEGEEANAEHGQGKVDDDGGANDGNGDGDDEPPLTVQGYPIEVWPNMVGDIRDRLAESGASDESTAMAGSVHGSADEAGLIGEFSKHLKAVCESLEGERAILQNINSSRRMPAFARKDLVIVKRRELDATRAAGLEAVEGLTASLGDGALELLQHRAAKEACCDAVDGLSIAWSLSKANAALRTGGGSARGGRRGEDPLAKPRKRRGEASEARGRDGPHGGGGESRLTEAEAEQLAEADTALDDAAMLVDGAAKALAAELRRRRTNVAVASAAHVRGDDRGRHAQGARGGASQASPDSGGGGGVGGGGSSVVPIARLAGPRAGRTDRGTARFDNYARGRVPEVGGTLAMAQRGKAAAKQRKAEERGSVRSCCALLSSFKFTIFWLILTVPSFFSLTHEPARRCSFPGMWSICRRSTM